MGLEESKTPLKPVLLLEKGSSSCTLKLITCQSRNDTKELKFYTLVCCGVNLFNSIGLSGSAVWIHSSYMSSKPIGSVRDSYHRKQAKLPEYGFVLCFI